MPTQHPSLFAMVHRLSWLSSVRLRLAHHPRGLYLLCLAVLCERWAASILASSLVLMLCERYGQLQSEALRWSALYNAASYLLTLPGGFAVDRSLGARRSLGIGMALLTCGYAALTIAAPLGLWLAGALLLLGHSLFKPSAQAVMVLLYQRYDPRLEAAQIVFYFVINIAVTAGAVCAGLLVYGHEFRTAFALAAVILSLGTLAVFIGNESLRLRTKRTALSSQEPAPPLSLSTQLRVRRIAVLTLAMLLFTVGFGQVEGSLLFWAQDRTDRVLLGFEIPPAWFVGLPALLVLLLAPVQLAFLPRLQHWMGTPRLIGLGLCATLLAFAVLIPPALLFSHDRVSMLWLVLCMTLLVVGELLIAPLGLALLLRLTPARFVGVVLGVWYVAGALGCWLAGEVGAVWVDRMRR